MTEKVTEDKQKGLLHGNNKSFWLNLMTLPKWLSIFYYKKNKMKKALIIAKPKTIQYIVLRNSCKSAEIGKMRLPLSFPNAMLNHQVGVSFLLFLLMIILPSFDFSNFIVEVMHPLKRKLYGNF